MRKILFALLFLSLFIRGFSQLIIMDSLKIEFKNAVQDSTRCNILNAMIENETDDNIWPQYNNEVKNISEANLKSINDKSPLWHFYLKNLAGALNNIGYLSKFRGDIPKALDYYHQSLSIYEKIKDEHNTANALNNVGFVYKEQGDIPKALDFFFKNLKLYTKINDKSGVAITLNNIGSIYSDQGKLKEALDCYKKSLIIQENLKQKRVIAYNLNNIGFVYFKQSKLNVISNTNLTRGELLNLALEYFQKSFKIREEIQDKRGASISLENIAEALLDLGMTKEAKIYAEQSLQISKELGYPDNIKRSSSILSKIYSKMGNWKDAFDMQVLYKLMSDSVSNEVNRKNSIQKSFQYEYDKKVAADSVKTLEEHKVFNAQLKQERTQRFALLGGIVLVGLFGVFMFNRFKITKKQNHLIQLQKTELQKQKELVEEHQKETLDSIHYAKRIQTALIANSDFISQHIPNNFIYFNPKDIVSGDFYWATKHNDKFYLAVCDSTGHGVPGAFMSLLNMGFLSEAIKEKNIEKPNEIFNYVRERLISTISDGGQKDGMDGILICIDINSTVSSDISTIITYAAANNEPILIRNNEILELPKDKMPVGKGEKTNLFALQTIELKSGDALYLYTDGFADQFGGPKGKKFKYKPLNELLVSIKDLALLEQKNRLETAFTNWQGNQEQVDDVLIIGIKI